MRRQIYEGDATIIISKQKFFETASECAVKTMYEVMTLEPDLFVKLFAVYLARLTYELFDNEEVTDNG